MSNDPEQLTAADREALEAYLDSPEAAARLEQVRPSMPRPRSAAAALTDEERAAARAQGEAFALRLRRSVEAFAAFHEGLEAAGLAEVPDEEPEPEPMSLRTMLAGTFVLGVIVGFVIGALAR